MNKGSPWPWITTAFFAGACATLGTLWQNPQLLQPKEQPLPGVSGAENRNKGAASYADAVALAGPAVVNIFSTKVRTERQSLAFRDPYLQRHYGGTLPERLKHKSATNLGSGVIISRDGLLLTNHHIVKDADEIKVVLADGSHLDVTVVGFDPETDLAVLNASTTDLPVVSIGRPEDLRVGDVVLAIGNPFGIGQTVTMGIVGATGRTRLGISSIENFIQTDAAINPGNSGGALINARGELIGINTAIFSQSGGSEGVGFAIPADLATDVMKKIVAGGRVTRGWIGVVGRSVTPRLAEAFGLRTEQGVLISSTLENSPAAQVDLRPGDVVTRVDGEQVSSTHELLEAIASASPGAAVLLEIRRGSERIEVTTTTIERPSATAQ